MTADFMSDTSERSKATVVTSIVALIYISICIETDMYIPALPQMVVDFNTREADIHRVLEVNFFGLCLSGVWVGPIADSFGRRRVLLWGLAMFTAASAACALSSTLPQLLFWRFIQGVGAGAPWVAAYAVLFDCFPVKTAASLVGLMNTVVTLSMSGAPIVGNWITMHHHWRTNFVVIAAIGSVAWLSFFFIIPETLLVANRNPFRLKRIAKDFGVLLMSPEFIGFSLLCTMIFGGLLVFVANQSLIFINYLKVSPAVYGFYQAISMATFAIGSMVSGTLIRKVSVSKIEDACLVLGTLGSAGLLVTAYIDSTNIPCMCAAMVLLNCGGGLGIGSFAARAMSVFPGLKATASGATGSIRLVLSSIMVALSARYFDGSILPIAWIIVGSQAVSWIAYLGLRRARLSAATLEHVPF